MSSITGSPRTFTYASQQHLKVSFAAEIPKATLKEDSSVSTRKVSLKTGFKAVLLSIVLAVSGIGMYRDYQAKQIIQAYRLLKSENQRVEALRAMLRSNNIDAMRWAAKEISAIPDDDAKSDLLQEGLKAYRETHKDSLILDGLIRASSTVKDPTMKAWIRDLILEAQVDQ